MLLGYFLSFFFCALNLLVKIQTKWKFVLKPSRNKKGQNFLKLHQKWCLFLQMAAEKKTPCLVQQEKISASLQCTLVGLSTRPAPLTISKSLQFRTFGSQSKALFMIRCMLSIGSGSKMFGALKVTIYVKFFKLSVHKMSTFLRISACQWTMPSGLFAKKSHAKFFCSC